MPKAKEPSPADTEETPNPVPQDAPRYPVWIYGCNKHLDDAKFTLPDTFSATGILKVDMPKACTALGTIPHPAFKVHMPPQKSRRLSVGRRGSYSVARRPSVQQDSPLEKEMAAYASALNASVTAHITVRSMLMDVANMQVLSMLLPQCNHLKSLSFSDSQLDVEMLRYLRVGLENSKIDALQVEWNPVEVPSPTVEELQAAGYSVSPRENSQELSVPAPGGAEDGEEECALDSIPEVPSSESDVRERYRYRHQCARNIVSFRSWICEIGGGDMSAVANALRDAPSDKGLSHADFVNIMEESLGATGAQVGEIYDLLDSPDFVGTGAPEMTVASVLESLEAVEVPPSSGEEDLIGTRFAAFCDEQCLLESVSFRACAIGPFEIGPIAAALGKCPWQLRCLNLWDNRISDSGAAKLCEALTQYRGLEFLGLGRNRITDKGMVTICQVFQSVIVDEEGRIAAQAKIKEQETQIEAKEKAAAKAKAKAAPKAAPAGKPRREPIMFVDALEERPAKTSDGESIYHVLLRSALKTLNLSENPIRLARTIEDLQTLGPTGVELLIKGTGAASALMAQVPELATKERRPYFPDQRGWLVRLT